MNGEAGASRCCEAAERRCESSARVLQRFTSRNKVLRRAHTHHPRVFPIINQCNIQKRRWSCGHCMDMWVTACAWAAREGGWDRPITVWVRGYTALLCLIHLPLILWRYQGTDHKVLTPSSQHTTVRSWANWCDSPTRAVPSLFLSHLRSDAAEPRPACPIDNVTNWQKWPW